MGMVTASVHRIGRLLLITSSLSFSPGLWATPAVRAIGSPGTLSANVGYNCAIVETGNVLCWGSQSAGLMNPSAIRDLAGATRIASGIDFACAIVGEGRVRCWGDNDFGQLGNGSNAPSEAAVEVIGIQGATSLAANGNSACAVVGVGNVKCWGYGGWGTLGNGDTLDSTTPVNVIDVATATDVALGYRSGCALLAGGGVKCWGGNLPTPRTATAVAGLDAASYLSSKGSSGYCAIEGGGVGCWSVAASISTPTAVPGLSNVDQVSGGVGHACAHLLDKSIACWGDNFYGEIGDGSSGSWDPVVIPVPVVGLGGPAETVAVGRYFTCAALTGGEVKCWGSNSHAGVGKERGSPQATSVVGLSAVKSLAAGTEHTCALLDSNGVKCWGMNVSGELGDGTYVDSLTPVGVFGLSSGVSTLNAGGEQSCAVLLDTTGVCWGVGGIGYGATPTPIRNPQTPMGTLLSGLSWIGGGWFHSCAMLGGFGKCWGQNQNGELGNNSNLASNDPVDVSSITDATQMSSGANHNCAIVQGGEVACWGLNDDGQLGDSGTTSSSVPVPVFGITNATQVSAGYFSCARHGDSSVSCWGANDDGQLGNGGGVGSSVPVPVVGVSSAVEVGVGASHACALMLDGTVMCWGDDSFGQLGNGLSFVDSPVPVLVEGVVGATELAVGDQHACVRLSDGNAKCWGNNLSGQLGNGGQFGKFPTPQDVKLNLFDSSFESE